MHKIVEKGWFFVFDCKGEHVVCGLHVLLEANAIPSPIPGDLNDIVWFVNKDLKYDIADDMYVARDITRRFEQLETQVGS